ncbi:MAG: BatD family protein, partial [Saprospiraceae bacterium]
MSLRFLGLSLFFFIAISTVGKGQARFEATTDAKEIVAGNFFEVRFTLYDANGSNFSPPDFRPFTVVSGPNRSISTTSINGNVSHETSISYTLLAEKPGRWRVNPASISVKGKLYSTQAITIEVIESGKQKDLGNPGQEIFLVASVSDSVAFVGQQVLLDYTIYTTKNVESYNLLKESVYEGFFVEEIKRFNPRAVREVINGIQYTSKIIKRVALFPQQTGIIEIDPMMVQIGVEIEGSRPRSSFFFRRDLQYQNLGSNGLKLEVKSLPDGAPESFSGAVGKYEVNTNMGGTDLTTDDAFMLRLIIRGNGDEKRVSPPALQFPENFEAYPPRSVRDNSQETVGEINHVKEIEYLAVAKKPGHYTIQPEFSYFDTDSLKYISLYPQPIHLNISQGNQKGGANINT